MQDIKDMTSLLFKSHFHKMRPKKSRHFSGKKNPSTRFLLNMTHPYLFRKYDYVFNIDWDAMIINLDFNLDRDIISSTPTTKHVIVSGDTLVVNSAQVLWKNTAFTKRFLKTHWNMFDEKEKGKVQLWDNGYMASMLGGCWPNNTAQEKADCYNKVDFWPRSRRFGSEGYRRRRRIAGEISRANLSSVAHLASWAKHSIHWVPKRLINSYPHDYKEGDFVFHTPGNWLQCKSMWMREHFQEFLKYNNRTAEAFIHQGLLKWEDSWMWSTPATKPQDVSCRDHRP
mmetsp:Transcript_21977/g.61100  ORF Transcript_21977/g.61100 Transcript_21977/m.61100 type:complete len:284 (-) Transcript_21977:650-1501(-)